MLGAYAVSVRVSLINNVTAGLMGMSRLFGQTGRDAAALQRQLDRIKLTMAVGGGMAAAGGLGLWAISKTLAPAEKYAHHLSLMNAEGFKHVEIQKAITAGWETTQRVRTTTISGNLEAIRELRSVLGSAQEAINALPTVARMQAILSTVSGVKDSKGTAFAVARALDLRGASLDPARFQREADMMTRAIVASGGTLNPAHFMSSVKYGRTAGGAWSPEFLYEIAPTLMQAMGGGSGGGSGGPGNALMTAYSTVMNGKIAQKNLPLWMQLGLLDPSKIVWNKVGTAKGVGIGGVAGSDLFMTNPFLWTERYLIPALEKRGIRGERRITEYVGRMFGTRTEGQVMAMMAARPEMFRRDRRLIQGAMGLDAYERLQKTDPLMARQAMAAQWENIMTRLGIVVLPAFLGYAEAMINVLTKLSDWMGDHPVTVQVLTGAFVGLSGALLFAGTVTALTGAFKALSLVLGVAGGVGAAGAAGAGGAGLAGSAVAAAGALAPLAGILLAIAGAAGAIAAITIPGIGLLDRFAESDASPEKLAALRSSAKGEKNAKIRGQLEMQANAMERALQRKNTRQGRERREGLSGEARAAAELDAAKARGDSYSAGRWQQRLDAARAKKRATPPPPAAGAGGIGKVAAVYLDGKAVGSVVLEHSARDMERAARSAPSVYDTRMSPAPVAAGVLSA